MRGHWIRNTGIVLLALVFTFLCVFFLEQNPDAPLELVRSRIDSPGVFSQKDVSGNEADAPAGEADTGENSGAGTEDLLNASGQERGRLVLWYTRPDMSDYFADLAVDSREETGIALNPVLVEGDDLYDRMEEAQKTGEGPDLFLTDNGSLEKAYLTGFAGKIDPGDTTLSEAHFSQAALNAVTCDGSYVAWPLAFDTSFLIYNRTYVEEYAKNQIEAERAQAAADAAEDGQEPEDTESATEEEIAERVSQYLPVRLSDIETFGEEYDPPEQVESIFQWDISDVFYTYCILGDCIDLGGPAGDSEDSISIRGENSGEALKEYKALLEFFSLEDTTLPYSQLRQAFVDGKLVFAIASTDILKDLSEASEAGNVSWEYTVCPVPNVTDNVAAKPLSVTQCLCVSGYSENQALGREFAAWAVTKEGDLLYRRTGMPSPCLDVTYEDPHIEDARSAYAASSPVCKLMTRSDFWMQIENAYLQVQKGADPLIVLQQLEAALM